MILVIQPADFALNFIFFMEKKMNIIVDGSFTKILFSDDSMIMNGIFIDIAFQSFVKHFSSRNVIQIDSDANRELINTIANIECGVIDYYIRYFNVTNKTPVYSLKTSLSNGDIKYYKGTTIGHHKYYIKISGVWETHNELGVTYKMVEY
jgi:hypothetical protein